MELLHYLVQTLHFVVLFVVLSMARHLNSNELEIVFFLKHLSLKVKVYTILDYYDEIE